MSRISVIEVIQKGPAGGGLSKATADTLYPAKAATEAAIARTDPGVAGQFRHAYAEQHGVSTASADNAAALQAILNTYDKVEFAGTGTFLTGEITVPSGTTLIIPEGVTLKLKDGANTRLISCAGRVVGDGTLDGNKANQTATDLQVVYNPPDATRARVKINRIISASGPGVLLDGVGSQCVGVEIEDAISFGIWSRASKQLIDACTVVNAGEAGIRPEGTHTGANHGTRIVGCHVDHTGVSQICIEAWTANYGEMTGLVVSGCTTVGGLSGISCDKQQGAAVSGCTVRGFSTIGLELAGSKHCTLSGNTADGLGAGNTGISCSNTDNSFNAVSGNTIMGCTNKTIHCFQGHHYSITGNIITGSAGNVTDGIYLQETGSSTVTGNTIHLVKDGIVIEAAENLSAAGNTITDANRVVVLYMPSAGVYDHIAFASNACEDFGAGIVEALVSGTLGPNVVFRANPGLPDYLDYANRVMDTSGTGTPEGVVTAGVGSRFLRRDGASGSTLYVKTTGSGNTGWEAAA